MKLNTKPEKIIPVAVGVIKNNKNEVLLAQRHIHAHQGGLWEFPGGKIEINETAEQALIRELEEELNIIPQTITPLITIRHSYTDLNVCLFVFTVTQFTGSVFNKERQVIKWVKIKDLSHYAFPQANKPIIQAVQLPAYYAILDDTDEKRIFVNLEILLRKGIKLIQARLKRLSADTLKRFCYYAQPLCEQYGALLLFNSDVIHVERFALDGLHLTSRALLALTERPKQYRYVAASCHNLEELKHAEKIGVDFVVIAPVLATPTHPDTEPLGWQNLAELIQEINVPCYALGGLTPADLITARQMGAQGISAIRAFL
jgi:8-oxo-dGTP diphosphatase